MFLSLYVKARAVLASMRERLVDDRGAVATEYALLLILIALAIIAAATALGLAIAGKFSAACTSLSGSSCGP